MSDKLEKLNKFLEVMQSETITPKQLESLLVMVLDVIKKSKDKFEEISKDNLNKIQDFLAYIENENKTVQNQISQETLKQSKEFNLKISEIKDILSQAQNVLSEASNIKDGVDGIDGKDADEEKIIKEVLNQIPKIDIPEINGEEIVNQINSLSVDNEDLKIQATHIKGLINFVQKTGGTKNFYQLLDVSLNNLTNGQVPVWNSTTQLWENGTILGGISVGEPVTGGIINTILYIDNSGQLASSTKLQWDNNLRTLEIGGIWNGGMGSPAASASDLVIAGDGNKMHIQGSIDINTLNLTTATGSTIVDGTEFFFVSDETVIINNNAVAGSGSVPFYTAGASTSVSLAPHSTIRGVYDSSVGAVLLDTPVKHT